MLVGYVVTGVGVLKHDKELWFYEHIYCYLIVLVFWTKELQTSRFKAIMPTATERLNN